MNVSIIKGSINYLNDCADILKDSELGKKYFINEKDEYIGKQLLKEGFDNNEIFIGINSDNNCVGFVWIQKYGIFHWFPFLHVIVVKKEVRGKGIGKQLMGYFEQISFNEYLSKKTFLMVGIIMKKL